ncbi:tetratricopeptide repeat protein [Bizionia gelidisalsuginis]|uniref:Tetratricopeptide repeat protein n=2 Tax=Bizionia TaxID=283785 RepID=A0A8H2LLT6_9FLAO|nr:MULTISPECIES: histidine kinase [Bizionia]TYB73982.1 tetratricopeptide repeat protein [Bizionia saleffrena]TYC09213.1 tetratricopeptide repeat protein [Bizionia gelidisalsuginis]
MIHFKHISLIVFLVVCPMFLMGQTQPQVTAETKNSFIIKGFVRESETYIPLKNVNIHGNLGSYAASNLAGEFKIEVRIGDELIISHKDFETIYYTVTSDDDLTIDVRPAEGNQPSALNANKQSPSFSSLLDSALVYKNTSAEKSIQFITQSISKSNSTAQNARAFEVLADVYTHWKQYDLAVSNYRISLNSNKKSSVELKLAKGYYFNKNYQESIALYQHLIKEKGTTSDRAEVYEGLGDVFSKTKQHQKAITAYQLGLTIAKKQLITTKVTDLNSKIAEAYNASGAINEAGNYYKNALNLATKENKQRAIKEKIKVADFNSANRAYKVEIKLRKESLQDIQDIEADTIIDNASDYTLQKQNYKIGNAYYLQQKYEAAIPYLQRSIVEADKREDLVVEKDAKRKLSEVYRDAGDFEKALKAYEEYTQSVEKLYLKKEQQITQASRFSRNIAAQQNRIESLESDRELSESKYHLNQEQNKLQTLIIYSLIGGVLLLLLAAYVMYKFIKQQKLANNLLALKSLRSQMNPHFIFNALNSVNSFIATNDERAANKYLSDFSKLMRAVLENSEENFIPLTKEIELIELYTKLEHFRFKDKFEYVIEIDKNIEILDYNIPPMLLQPYIENAVWHGLRYKKEKGELRIAIYKKTANAITISITDNGIGRDKSKALKTDNQKKQNSKGMGNIKKRVSILNAMYKDTLDVSISDLNMEDGTGTQVLVTLKKH